MNKQHIKEIISRAKRGKKKIMEKLNRAQKCSILGPQNLGLGGPGPWGPPGSAPGNANPTSGGRQAIISGILSRKLHEIEK